jgi:hypothetical protein
MGCHFSFGQRASLSVAKVSRSLETSAIDFGNVREWIFVTFNSGQPSNNPNIEST